jgi:hypothetical protein
MDGDVLSVVLGGAIKHPCKMIGTTCVPFFNCHPNEYFRDNLSKLEAPKNLLQEKMLFLTILLD